jgi:peptidoglycan/LPS O-acetylase OafA/YrhL
MRIETDASPSSRLAFADLLRGLAAFLVMLGHYTILYLDSPAVVAALTNAEPAQTTPLPQVIVTAYATLDVAATGVAVFFLISGFVIPLSLEGSGIGGFFIKRLMRIYPTFWVALALNVAALFVSSAWWHKPVEHGMADYISNAALLTEFSSRHFDIPSVMWTLQIEMKFYLLAPLFYLAIRRGIVWALLVWALGVVAAYWLATAGCAGDVGTCWGHRGPIVYVAWEAMYISYMLIGSVIYAHYRGAVATPAALGLIAVIFGCFVASFFLSPLIGAARGTLPAYVWGIAIFGGCYLLRSRIRLTPLFRFLADISYPLYVVHPLVGYVTMRILMALGLPYLAAMPVALGLALGLAWLIHIYVEEPTMALGKRLARRLAPRQADRALGPPASPRRPVAS